MKTLFKLLLILSLFQACDNVNKKEQTNNTPTTSEDNIPLKNPKLEIDELDISKLNVNKSNDEITSDINTQFDFELSLINEDYKLYNTNSMDNDTVKFELDLGETIGDQLIEITSNNDIEILSIKQCEMKSISVQNEGPHCDLDNVISIKSNCQSLYYNTKKSTFLTNEYSQSIPDEFYQIGIDSIKSIVLNECGSDWFDLVDSTITNKIEYPLGVGINAIIIEIEYRVNSIEKKKVLIFNELMGC